MSTPDFIVSSRHRKLYRLGFEDSVAVVTNPPREDRCGGGSPEPTCTGGTVTITRYPDWECDAAKADAAPVPMSPSERATATFRRWGYPTDCGLFGDVVRLIAMADAAGAAAKAEGINEGLKLAGDKAWEAVCGRSGCACYDCVAARRVVRSIDSIRALKRT